MNEKTHDDFLKLFGCIVEVDYTSDLMREYRQYTVIEAHKHMDNLDWS